MADRIELGEYVLACRLNSCESSYGGLAAVLRELLYSPINFATWGSIDSAQMV